MALKSMIPKQTVKSFTNAAIKLVVIYLLIDIFFPSKTYAYLDPGSGSYLFQILLAAVLGGIFSLKMFWKSIRSFITDIISKKKSGKKE